MTVVNLDCATGVLILGLIAGVYTALNVVLLSCIIWCACCYGKRKQQVRPLSPNNTYDSPAHGYPPVEGEMKNLRVSAQREARRLKTISESAMATGSDRVTVTTFTGKSSPFISRHPELNSDPSAWEEEKEDVGSSDSGCQGDNPSTGSSEGAVFVNDVTSSSGPVHHGGRPVSRSQSLQHPTPSPNQSLTSHERRKREAILQRRRAQRTESTKQLLGSSISSDISDPISDDISASVMSLPTTNSAMPSQMRVLSRHAGSRKKRRTDSMRSLITNMEDYERNTLPRSHRLPPLSSPRPLSSQAMSPLQTLTENTTLSTESVLNLSTERPSPNSETVKKSNTQSKSKGQPLDAFEPHSGSSTLNRLSLNLAAEIGLEDR